jgi:hypothetical protein
MRQIGYAFAQRRSFEIAHGEASEVRACLDVVAAWGWIVDSELPLQTLDRLLALLWRLTNGRAKDRAAPTRPRAHYGIDGAAKRAA